MSSRYHKGRNDDDRAVVFRNADDREMSVSCVEALANTTASVIGEAGQLCWSGPCMVRGPLAPYRALTIMLEAYAERTCLRM